VTLKVWDRCADRTQVHFYRIRGGKHVWPRNGVDASSLMWEFFSQYRAE
jgi:poly(3-hydroxybutyrate) depolymerase